MGRKTKAAYGCTIGKAMGVNTWAAFGGIDESAIVDGVAVAEAELQNVLQTLRTGGINLVATHSHMAGKSPRILFLNYWGHGKAAELATTVRRALDKTAWDDASTTT